MGLRWKAEFSSIDYDGTEAKDYTVHIIDTTTGTDPETEFTVAKHGLNIKGDANRKDQTCTLVSTKCTMKMIVDRSGVEDFITLLAGANEGRFWLRVKRGGSIIFIGVIVTEGAYIEDLDYPFEFKVTALDELARLKNRKFRAVDASNPLVNYSVSFFRYLSEIFSMSGLSDFYGTGEAFIEFYGGPRSASAANATDNPWTQIGIHPRAWDKKEGDTIQYTKVGDVLDQMLTITHSRLYFSNGVYIVEYIPYRAQNTTVDLWRYDIDFISISNPTGITVYNPAYTHGGATLTRMSGGKKTFMPPLQFVEITYTHDVVDDYYIDDYNYTFGDTITDNNVLIASSEHRLAFRTTVVVTNEDVLNAPFRVILKMEIKLGTKWLKREYSGGSFLDPEYGATTWESTQSYYEYVTRGLPFSGDYKLRTSIGFFIDDPLVNDFTLNDTLDLEVTITMVEYVDQTGARQTIDGVTPEATVTATRISFYPTDENGDVLERTRSVFRALNSNDNTATVEMEVPIGEGPAGFSKTGARVDNGTSFIGNVEDWGTGAKNLLQLLAESIMALQKVPTIKLTNWTLIADTFLPHWYFTWDSSTWMMLSYNYNCDKEEIKGEWLQVDYDATGLTDEKDEYKTFNDPFSPTGGGIVSEPSGPGGGGVAIPTVLIFDDVTTGTIDIGPGPTLPDTGIGSQAMEARVQVFVSGIAQRYERPLGWGVGADNQEIKFYDRKKIGTRNLNGEEVKVIIN